MTQSRTRAKGTGAPKKSSGVLRRHLSKTALSDYEKEEFSFSKVFDRVVIISLASRKDRRLDVTLELARIGLEPGTGGVEFFDAVRPVEAGDFPSIGARGCFLSHLTLLEASAQAQISSLLILEDDVGFVRDISEKNRMLGPALSSEEWSIFYGGYSGFQEDIGQGVRTSLVNIEPDREIGQTHCIGLRGTAIVEAAKYLRAMLSRPAGAPDGGPMHVDGAYSWYRREHPERRTLAASPAIAYQRPSRSDIFENLAWYDKSRTLRPVLSNLRRWKRHFSPW